MFIPNNFIKICQIKTCLLWISFVTLMNDAELLKVLFKKMLSWSKRDMKQLMIFRRDSYIINKIRNTAGLWCNDRNTKRAQMGP